MREFAGILIQCQEFFRNLEGAFSLSISPPVAKYQSEWP